MVVALAVGGCAGLDVRSPESIVRDRAQERWDDLVKNDFQAAYGFLSPGSKQVIGEKDYVERLRKGFWKSAKVEGVKCPSPNACNVAASIEYEFMGRRTKTPLQEQWIKEGSTWWYVYKP